VQGWIVLYRATIYPRYLDDAKLRDYLYAYDTEHLVSRVVNPKNVLWPCISYDGRHERVDLAVCCSMSFVAAADNRYHR